MKYVALLRGINVGGKSTVSMSSLKEAFQKAGFEDVSTYINSGNVLFTSETKNIQELTRDIEALLEKTFFPIHTVVLSYKELEQVMKDVPSRWEKEDVRKYITFLKDAVTPEDVMKEVQRKDGVDFIDKGPGVVYMTTQMDGLTRSGFPKLISKPIYKFVTMRNYNTIQKLFSLMSADRK